MKNGSFRPSRWRSAATISFEALAPTYARAGSPGETYCSTKITNDKVNRITTAAESRRVRKASIGYLRTGMRLRMASPPTLAIRLSSSTAMPGMPGTHH